MDNDKLAKKLSEFDITEHRVNVLKDSGIIAVGGSKHDITNNYPGNIDISSVIFRGPCPSGSKKVLYYVLKKR